MYTETIAAGDRHSYFTV